MVAFLPRRLNFNPRTRAGCDLWGDVYTQAAGISIHAPARGATSTESIWRLVRYISIHAPARGATLSPPNSGQSLIYFNPRTRAGCDLLSYCHSLDPSKYFNPRTRAGCDQYHLPSSCPQTHFNPRTRAGCDRGPITTLTYVGHFNPRTRAGCDIKRNNGIDSIKYISIHAPARGATLRSCGLSEQEVSISIHAPARGATSVILS